MNALCCRPPETAVPVQEKPGVCHAMRQWARGVSIQSGASTHDGGDAKAKEEGSGSGDAAAAMRAAGLVVHHETVVGNEVERMMLAL